MARAQPVVYEVQDAKTKSSLRVKGYGALRGTIVFRKDIDLTRPIFEQVVKGDEVAKRDSTVDD